MAGDDTGKGGRADAWSDMSDPTRALNAAVRLAHRASAPSEVWARRRFLDFLDPRPGEMVVDVGAGSGIVALDIAARVVPGGRVFAVDPSAPLLEHARSAALAAGHGPVIDCRVADGAKLPFGPAAFDAAFCHWVLLHVDEPAAIIAEMKRVTRRGGRVMCVEADWETVVVQPGETGLTRRILNHSADRHVDGWMGRRLVPLFRDAGLRDVTVEPIVSVDQGHGDRTWLEYCAERAKLAVEAGVISRAQASEWTLTLEAAFSGGHFFFAFTQFAVMAKVPG